MNKWIACLALATAVAQPALAQQRPLKVLLLYDMEGISEAVEPRHTSFTYPEQYAFGRRALTADVNAAIAGLKAAGATEIVVVDGHGSGNSTGPDVLEDQLLAPARMHYRDTPFDIYMDSYDHSFDAIVAVAMHAGAGNRIGFLAHTCRRVRGGDYSATGRMRPVITASSIRITRPPAGLRDIRGPRSAAAPESENLRLCAMSASIPSIRASPSRVTARPATATLRHVSPRSGSTTTTWTCGFVSSARVFRPSDTPR